MTFEIICNRCRATVSADAEVCPECGTVLISRPGAAPVPPPAEPPAEPGPTSPPATPAQPVRLEGVDLAAAYRAVAAGREPSVGPTSYAGFWIRVGATLTDSFLTLLVVVPVHFSGHPVAASLLYAAAFLVYYPLMEGSSAQGTVGKLACGIAVTDTEGRRISYGRAYARVFGRVLCSLTANLGYLLVIFTRRKQGLQDLVASTLVLYRGSY